MFLSNMYSHPNKKLHTHLMNVAQACVTKSQSPLHNLSSFFDTSIWQDLIWLMGFSHDFGKATHFFQTYLFEPNEQIRMTLKQSPTTNHSLLSAVFAFWIIQAYAKSHPVHHELFGMMPFLIFLIIKKHHGNIHNPIPVPDETTNDLPETESEVSHLDAQLQAIDVHELNYLFDIIGQHVNISLCSSMLPESFVYYFKQSIRARAQRTQFKRVVQHTAYYIIFQWLYSLLLHSDKTDAIFNEPFYSTPVKLDEQAVKKFKQTHFGKPQNQMDHIREAIFSDAEQTIATMDLRHRILSLNVPTGTGKTLTTLSVALQLQHRLLHEKKSQYKIIYALPFTSIIDQNYHVFSQIFDQPNANMLLKHHHLADISYQTDENEF